MIGNFNLVAALLGALVGSLIVWIPGWFILKWVLNNKS
jgi:hypothetical protein